MKVFKKIMNAVAAVENCILVVSTLLILILTVGNVFSRKVIHRSWSLYRGACGCSLCSYYLNGCRTCMSRRRAGQPVLGYRPSSQEAEKTIRNPFHCTLHYFYCHLILVWHGQSNHTAGERQAYLRTELAGMDFLVLCSNRIRMHDFTFY